MAIDYDLDCATQLSVAEVANLLDGIGKGISVFGASVTPDLLMKPGANARLGTWVRVTEEGPKQPWDPIVAGLGFTPTVSVSFRMAKGVEVSDQQDDMIRLVLRLLDQVGGDLVLHRDFEDIWLLRRNDELTLSEDDDLWRPHRLALVPGPYRRETHTME
jgi:hypothetical protein